MVCAVAAVDMMLHASIAPLLVHYRHELHLSTSGAGLLGAAYSAGTLAATLPALWLTNRLGPRRTVMVGVAVLTLASLGFALSTEVVSLDAARFVQGGAGACAWIGALSWLIEGADPARRGALIGAELAASVIGETLGPVLGIAATTTSPGFIFTSVAVVCVGLLVIIWAVPESPRRHLSERTLPRRSASATGGLAGLWWLATLPALLVGTLTVLGPLHLADGGVSTPMIGLIWFAGAAVETVVGPLAGRISDRRGRLLPVRIGLACTVPLVFGLAVAQRPLVEAVLIVATIIALGWLWAPATALLCDGAETRGAPPVLAFALVNAGWAAGQLVGGAGGGALAQATTQHVPYIVLGVLAAGTLIWQVSPRPIRRRATAEPASLRSRWSESTS